MAWQTPKTNWQAPDGVRDTDFNRIEGNILELYNTSKVNAAITINVATTGSDTSGNGSSTSPYRTITHALNTIPKNLNGKDVLIYVDTGTYAENVAVKGFSNGKIILAGYYGYTVTVLSLEVSSSICEIRSLVIATSTAGVTVTDGGVLFSNAAIRTSGGTRGLYVTNCSLCRIYAMLTVNNALDAAVQVSGASSCYILQLAGSANENAIMAEEGSIVGYGSTNISVNVAGYITRTGGRIYTGGQTSMPNY